MNEAAPVWDYVPFIMKGIPITLMVTGLAMALAIVVSVILALGRSSSVALLRWPTGFIIELFRGSSALVQLFWAFYVLPFFGITLSPLAAGIIVLGLNEGSYFSEVVRSGLNAVAKGQREAALALGFSRSYRFFRIVLPQALPLMIPPFGNALVTMLKFSALVSLVTVQELAFRGTLVAETIGSSAPVYSITITTYFVLALALGGSVRLLERYVNQRSGREVTRKKQGGHSQVPDWAWGKLG